MIAMMVQHEDGVFQVQMKWFIWHDAFAMMLAQWCIHHDAMMTMLSMYVCMYEMHKHDALMHELVMHMVRTP